MASACALAVSAEILFLRLQSGERLRAFPLCLFTAGAQAGRCCFPTGAAGSFPANRRAIPSPALLPCGNRVPPQRRFAWRTTRRPASRKPIFLRRCELLQNPLDFWDISHILKVPRSSRYFQDAHKKANPRRAATLRGFFVLTCPYGCPDQATCTRSSLLPALRPRCKNPRCNPRCSPPLRC